MSLTAFRLKDLRIIVSRHKASTLLIILFLTVILSIFGSITVRSDQAQASARLFEETYGNKVYYITGESLNDAQFYDYRDEDSTGLYGRLTEFSRLLSESDCFDFIELTYQPVAVFEPRIPETFYDGYEAGCPNKPFYYKKRLYQSVKSIQVSESFFREFGVSVSSGDCFAESDYCYRTGDSIPVLLGSEYKDGFSVGDVLYGNYFEDCSFIVKGFISEDSFFYYPSNNEMISCSRYIVLPSVSFDTVSEAAKLSLLQKISGIVSSSLGYAKTVEQVERCMDEAGLKRNEVYISYPDSFRNGPSLFEQYSAMTNEAAAGFTAMVIIIMLFGTVAAAITLCSMLRENRLNFGIEMLCGATRRDVFIVALLFLSAVLLVGDALSVAIVPKAFFSIQSAVLCMLLVSALITAFIIKKMDMHDIIGGNE